MDVESNSGSFAHRHCGVAGHAGEVAAAVSVGGRDGEVAPGCYPLPVWQHLLHGEEMRSDGEREEDGVGRI